MWPTFEVLLKSQASVYNAILYLILHREQKKLSVS